MAWTGCPACIRQYTSVEKPPIDEFDDADLSKGESDPKRSTVSEKGGVIGKVVVNRVMSLDGYVPGPGHTMELDLLLHGERRVS